MNFTENLVLKENYTFLVAGDDGMVRTGEQGLYNRDTRFLNRYAWTFGTGLQLLVSETPQTDLTQTHHALIDGPEQLVGVERTVRLDAKSLNDQLLVSNTSLETQTLELALEFTSDFADLFEVRGWHMAERAVVPNVSGARAVDLVHDSEDGLQQAITISFN